MLDNLIERGTQHVCLRTQWVDLIVIAGLPVTLFVLHLMRAKAHRGEPGWPRLLRDVGFWFDRNRCTALCRPGTPR